MARPKKVGLDYFPLDIDFFEDIKIRKLIKYLGSKSISIYTYMLCKIYKEGYFIKWDTELPFIVSEATGSKEEYVNEVLKFCLKNHLFSEELYNKHNILSSKGIQERYKLICITAKRKFNISKYNLVNSEETLVNSEETLVNSEETLVNSEFSTQSKVKESKVKNSSNEELEKKTTKKIEVGVFENSNFEETPNSTSLKNFEKEKEKSSAKKEKELEDLKNFLVEKGADDQDVSEWFKKRIEENKPTKRYFVEKFTLECKKNNISVKDAVYACAFNGWVNFNPQWMLNQQNSKTSKNGSKEANNPNDPKIGRENLSAYEKLYKQIAGE
ncbi:DUF4373 domain-containing protein [Chishuiella sp.]|uniref:DUF4373 domain-containing protein n=1 Tax=Chishuiella sp. TaxID=1969467 RepID=UPI0028A8766C|nr:DUF4373 domain-containing protein [Chishuiella sp.]